MIQGPTFSSLLFVAHTTDQRHVLGGAMFVGIFLIVNAVYIVVSGRIGPNFGRYPETGKVLKVARRLLLASLYFAFGAAILVFAVALGQL